MQVVDGLKALLNPSGASTPSYISAFDSYNTALAFVQALGHTQDSNGDTVAVSIYPCTCIVPTSHICTLSVFIFKADSPCT